MGLGPIGASKKALQRASLSMDKIDIIEYCNKLTEFITNSDTVCVCGGF